MVPIGKLSLVFCAMVFCAGNALATEDIVCSSADQKAAMGFVVGTTPGLNPLSLTMDAEGKHWATKPEGSQIGILIAQDHR